MEDELAEEQTRFDRYVAHQRLLYQAESLRQADERMRLMARFQEARLGMGMHDVDGHFDIEITLPLVAGARLSNLAAHHKAIGLKEIDQMTLAIGVVGADRQIDKGFTGLPPFGEIIAQTEIIDTGALLAKGLFGIGQVQEHCHSFHRYISTRKQVRELRFKNSIQVRVAPFGLHHRKTKGRFAHLPRISQATLDSDFAPLQIIDCANRRIDFVHNYQVRGQNADETGIKNVARRNHGVRYLRKA